MRSHFATSKLEEQGRGGRRYNPRVFTEQGVAMLATVLKSPVATRVSIAIMDAFVMMRKYISNNLLEQNYINNMVLEHDKNIKLLQNSFSKFEEKRKNNEIYFNDSFHDRYFILDDKEVYHCGTSINRIGYRTFSMTLISDIKVRNAFQNKLNEII